MEKIPLEEKPTVAFDYIKTDGFHSLHVDGVIGGLTPRGDVNMAFFAERSPIPRRLVHEINEDGSLGAVKEIESRQAIVREVSAGIVISKQVAIDLHTWLGERIEELKKRQGENGERTAPIR